MEELGFKLFVKDREVHGKRRCRTARDSEGRQFHKTGAVLVEILLGDLKMSKTRRTTRKEQVARVRWLDQTEK